jgi:hypothetical protein
MLSEFFLRVTMYSNSDKVQLYCFGKKKAINHLKNHVTKTNTIFIHYTSFFKKQRINEN